MDTTNRQKFLEKEDILEEIILNIEVLTSVLQAETKATTLNVEGRKRVLPA